MEWVLCFTKYLKAMKKLIQLKKIKIRKLLTSTLFILCLLLFNSGINAQSRSTKAARKMNQEDMENFQKLMDDPKALHETISGQGGHGAKYERKTNYSKGYCTEEDYQIPKKVGVLSFYIHDDDYSTYSSDWITTYKATEEKVNAVAQRLFDQSIDGLKEQYAQMGMELLTPDEFLISEEMKNVYFNYPLPNMEGKAYVWGAAGSGAAIPDGFRLLPYASIAISGNKFAKEKSDFFEALGLDAFIVVEVGLIAANGSIKNIRSMFYNKNPGWEASGMEGIGVIGYTPHTISMTSIEFKPPMKGLFIKEDQEYKNKNGKTEIKFVNVDLNPNVSALVETVVTRTGTRSVWQITHSPLKDKKKKKKK